MKTRIPFKPKIILMLSLAGIGMNAISAFFFIRLDHLVHVDLYNYGLHFNNEWAVQYWTYSKLTLGCLAVAMSATGISIVSILIHTRTRSISSRLISYLLLALGIAMAGFSAFFFNRLNCIVNGDLYNYGLQFSYEWSMQYWTYASIIFGLLGLAITTTVISIALIFLSARPLVGIDTMKLICATLISAGAIALALSINYTSSILAFIGLGLVFWGAILLYIQPEEYTKKVLLDAAVLPALTTVNQIMQELDYEGKAIYLPPKYLVHPEGNKVYIPKQKDGKLPTPEQILKHEGQLFIKNPQGIVLTPPGAELTKLIEKTLGTSLTKVDLEHLQQNLPKLFIEDLEIAENLEMEIKRGNASRKTNESVFPIKARHHTIHVKITNSVYKDVCREAMKLQRIYGSVGCPICNAIACALAKATAKPVIIEKTDLSADGKTIEANFRLLEGIESKVQTEAPLAEVSRILPARLLPNLASLFLTVFGSIILAWIGWLTWYDMTTWGKDVAIIFFGSRTGEATSLGMDMKVIHYLLIGLTSLLTGLLTFLRRRRSKM